MDLDQFDAEVAGPMRVRDGENILVIPPATELHWRNVVSATLSDDNFVALVWPEDVPARHWLRWKIELTRMAWVRHNGLVDGDELKRLVYMMEKYADGIEYDLRHHLDVSAGELWRGRHWRELLAYIDMLPNDSHKNRLLTMDEEHMAAIIMAQQKQKDREANKGRPSMADWGQLESMMAVLIDAVNRNTEVVHAVAPGKKQPLRIAAFPRPATAAEKVERNLQKKQHEEMVATLLPAKRSS